MGGERGRAPGEMDAARARLGRVDAGRPFLRQPDLRLLRADGEGRAPLEVGRVAGARRLRLRRLDAAGLEARAPLPHRALELAAGAVGPPAGRDGVPPRLGRLSYHYLLALQ